MSLLSKLQSTGKKRGSRHQGGNQVDAMLVACVHEPEIPVTPASGEPLKQLARKSLATADPSLVLNRDAYVRFILIGDGPEVDLAVGLMPTTMPPGVNPRHMAFLAGAKSMSDHEKDATELLPREMTSVLLDRKLDPADYEIRSFSETPDPGVKFLWMAAVHK